MPDTEPMNLSEIPTGLLVLFLYLTPPFLAHVLNRNGFMPEVEKRMQFPACACCPVAPWLM
nr:MAG TPA: hypothetical protein [Caudoviricetes sp.]